MAEEPAPFRLAVLAAPLLAHALLVAQPAVPALPAAGRTAEAFVPKGWKVLGRAEGDLNQDGRPDAVLVLASRLEDTDQEDPHDEDEAVAQRPLLVLLREADGTLRRAALHPDLVLCKRCGGVFGDPFAEVAVQRGAIVLSHYGGSSERWSHVHRFRLQDGGWFLIGRTSGTRHNLTGVSREVDENLLTGRVVETSEDEKGRVSVRRRKAPRAPLQRLEDVRIAP